MRQGRKEQRERDWLDRILDELQARKEQGESPSLVYLLEGLLNELMKRERERFLEQHPQEKANGFYRRSLRLTMGELKLSVPWVRYGHTFRPSILPPPWKRADRDYEELLIAMLANGYSRAIGAGPQVLGASVLPGGPPGRPLPDPGEALLLQDPAPQRRLVLCAHRWVPGQAAHR